MMPFPQVLVLGATGRLGTILRRFLPPAGRGRMRWQARREMPGPGWLFFDPLADGAALARAAEGCDAILCLAGVTPARAASGAELADNAALARAAVRAAGQGGCPRVLLASSAAVYGRARGLLREDMAPAPVSDYGRAKALMEERAAEAGAREGVAVTSLRIGNVAGADAILGGWRPGFRLDRFPDGRTPRRSYVGPATLARVLADLLAAPGRLPGALNLAAPGVVEMGALLDAAGLGWRARPAPPEAVAEVRLDLSRLLRLTSFAPAESRPETMVAQWHALEEDAP